MTYREIRIEVKQNPEKRFRHMIYWMRVAYLLTQKKSCFLKLIGKVCGSYYSFISGWLLGVDISYNTKIGKGLVIYHGMGLVINPLSTIGENIILRHNTTIGNAHINGAAPQIGDNVDVGCHSVIIGDIYIGDNCIIGAGTLINKNVPDNCIVVGNPAVIIKQDGILCCKTL